ncbi:MAG: hypothetical protein CMJ81_16640 [Planctomycetaceae bacterium]|nr:hypothetical protein [Planctomycetaceae bacterium]
MSQRAVHLSAVYWPYVPANHEREYARAANALHNRSLAGAASDLKTRRQRWQPAGVPGGVMKNTDDCEDQEQ